MELHARLIGSNGGIDPIPSQTMPESKRKNNTTEKIKPEALTK